MDDTTVRRVEPAAAGGGGVLRALRRSPAWLALSLATGLSLVWVFLPPGGSDLAAQVAHANFFGSDGWLPVDMRWFGGTDVLGYSIISPPLMSFFGVKIFGALTMVGASGLLGLLLAKFRVPHPRAAALVGTGCFAANLMAGRLTFGLGVAVALGTMLCLFIEGRSRFALLVLGTALTWAASPLAALFLAMIGVALVVGRRLADGSALAMTGGIMLLASVGLGGTGVMPMGADDLVRGVVACGVVALVTRYHVVRVVACLSALSLAFAYFVATPVGVNAIRFPAIFAIPVALATSRLRWRALILVLAGTLVLIPPMSLGDALVGQAADQPSYFAPLNRELQSLGLAGRVEVVPTADRWESVYVARRFPLARGWMTQVDNANNAIFFDPTLMTSARYRAWLGRNAVQYVAVSRATPATAGVAERALIDAGLPYLSPVWRGTQWTLYAVRNPTTTVTGATLLAQDAKGITFRVSKPGDVTLRVQWSRWLTLEGPGACFESAGRWTRIRVEVPGTYVMSSALLPDEQPPWCHAS